MDKATIEGRLRAEGLGRKGEITRPEGIDLQKISTDASKYATVLNETFKDLDLELLEVLIVDSTVQPYRVFLNPQFQKEASSSKTKYSPEEFLEASRSISLEMSNSDSLYQFHDLLQQTLVASDKFVYKLVVKDLTSIYHDYSRRLESAVTEEERVELKDRITKCVSKILVKAKEYSHSALRNKWVLFKENEFDRIRAEYFPDEEATPSETNGPLTLKYLEGLSQMDPKVAAQEIENMYGNLVSIYASGNKRTNDFGFKFVFARNGQLSIENVRTGRNIETRLRNLLEHLRGVATYNMSTSQYSLPQNIVFANAAQLIPNS